MLACTAPQRSPSIKTRISNMGINASKKVSMLPMETGDDYDLSIVASGSAGSPHALPFR